jgi:hypothetical protein
MTYLSQANPYYVEGYRDDMDKEEFVAWARSKQVELETDYGIALFRDLVTGEKDLKNMLLLICAQQKEYPLVKFLAPFITSESHRRSALHTSVCLDDYRTSQHLLEIGVSPNFRDVTGRTPLCIALDRYPFAKLLLDHGARPDPALDFVNVYSTTQRTLQLLLDYGANPFWIDVTGGTLLHIACMMEGPVPAQIIDYLIESGVNPASKDHYGDTALCNAFNYNEATAEYLLLLDIECYDKQEHPLLLLCRTDNLLDAAVKWGYSSKLIERYLRRGYNPFLTTASHPLITMARKYWSPSRHSVAPYPDKFLKTVRAITVVFSIRRPFLPEIYAHVISFIPRHTVD